MTTIIGIILGLTTAFSQTIGYVVTRLFVLRHKNAFWQLLLVSHLFMGALSLIAVPFLWPKNLPPWQNYLTPLLGAAGFYLFAQGGLFLAMRMTNPSRVAPLLGIKIIILSLLAVFFFDKELSLTQWIAIAACFGSILSLNFSGGSLPIKALLMILFTCTGYSLSDLHIDRLMISLQELPTAQAALWGAAMTYILLGVVALVVVMATRPKQLFADWHLSASFSLLWIVAIISLYGCIGIAGPVFTVILQSTRGLMSIVLGSILAKRGWSHIEQKISHRILLQRIMAAVLMILAVTLYAIG